MLPSLRNIPIMMWVAVSDELVPFTSTQLHTRALDDLDYRYEFWAFAPAEHLTLASFDQYEPSAAFLGDARVDRDPAHVTYVRNPKMDFSDAATTADHAYWLSGVEVNDASGNAPFGTIDVRSEGFGTSDPGAGDTQADAGQLSGGNLGSLGYQRQRKEWGSTPRAAEANRLVIDAKNVKSVTVDPKRARVTCAAQLVVTTDAPLTVTLAGCANGRQSFGAAAACGAKGLPRASVSRGHLTASRSRGLSSAGRAIAFKCVSNRRKPGNVGRVEISVARKSGKRCRHLSSSGRLGRTASCSRNTWLRAKLGRQRGGKVAWTFASKKKLPRGSYVLITRAVDNTGTVDHVTRKFGRKTFRVR
jgi:hypothetical protein